MLPVILVAVGAYLIGDSVLGDKKYAKGGKTQGYDDKEDERLAMEHGKMSKKDLDSTHARRDDARFEARGKMAKGGYVTDLDEVVASSDLKEELKSKMKEGDEIVAFGYTDYGGSFGDKVAIEYFKENHPKNIVFEGAAYNGQNGIVFGEVAKDFLEETEDYPLGYEDMESFYYQMQSEQEEKDFKLFLSDIKNKYTIKKDALDWLLENKSGYYSIEPNMVDFSYSELENELEEEGLIKRKKMAKGGKLVGKQKNLDVNKNGKLDAEDFKMLRGEKMSGGGLVVNSDEDLREVANYMAKAVKKRNDLKDLVYYFEKDNNYDYNYRVKIWDEMNVYEMKKTEDNIYKVLKAIKEANEAKK